MGNKYQDMHPNETVRPYHQLCHMDCKVNREGFCWNHTQERLVRLSQHNIINDRKSIQNMDGTTRLSQVLNTSISTSIRRISGP